MTTFPDPWDDLQEIVGRILFCVPHKNLRLPIKSGVYIIVSIRRPTNHNRPAVDLLTQKGKIQDGWMPGTNMINDLICTGTHRDSNYVWTLI